MGRRRANHQRFSEAFPTTHKPEMKQRKAWLNMCKVTPLPISSARTRNPALSTSARFLSQRYSWVAQMQFHRSETLAFSDELFVPHEASRNNKHKCEHPRDATAEKETSLGWVSSSTSDLCAAQDKIKHVCQLAMTRGDIPDTLLEKECILEASAAHHDAHQTCTSEDTAKHMCKKAPHRTEATSSQCNMFCPAGCTA